MTSKPIISRDGVALSPGDECFIRCGGEVNGVQRISWMRIVSISSKRVRLQRCKGKTGCYRTADEIFSTRKEAMRDRSDEGPTPGMYIRGDGSTIVIVDDETQ